MWAKGYDSIKIATIPKNAAECHGFKNQVVSAICKTCKGDETPLVAWIQRCSSVKDPIKFASAGNYPVLDRTLGHKLLENARGTRFSLSQHHLLSLKLNGREVKALEEFRQKLYYSMGSLEQSDMPQGSALRSTLYENLKHHPLLALAIDKY